MDVSKYPKSAQVTRVVDLIRLMFGHTIDGLAPGEIAKALGISAASATVTLAQLIDLGVVQEAHVPGRFRLGPALVQGALHHLAAIERAEGRLAEIKQRYSRSIEFEPTPELVARYTRGAAHG